MRSLSYAFNLVLLLASGATFNNLSASPGDLDVSFGDSGQVITPPTPPGESATSTVVVVYPDGRILVGGSIDEEFAIRRYLSGGTPDPTFGSNGLVTTSVGTSSVGTSAAPGVLGMALQPDGKIVSVGVDRSGTTPNFAVIRYNSDGSLDPSFSGNGILSIPVRVGSPATDVEIQPDGKIIVAGRSPTRFTLIRITEFGVLDSSFSEDGIISDVYGWTNAMALQKDGKIVLAGYSRINDKPQFTLLRYTATGEPDPTFSEDGKVETIFSSGNSVIEDIKIQDDGKIVVAGNSPNPTTRNSGLTVIRYNPNGDLDTSFAAGGIFNIADHTQTLGSRNVYVRCVALAVDGKIIVGGQARTLNPERNYFAFARLNRNGDLDPTFGDGGLLDLPLTDHHHHVNDLALQRDGKIVAVGYWSFQFQGHSIKTRSNFATIRLEGDPDSDFDGLPDYAENDSGIYTSPDNAGTDPNNPDSDGDGLIDGIEVRKHQTNPLLADSDSDGFNDGFEIRTGFDPASNLSTPDSNSIILTAVEFRFLAAAGETYRVESSTDSAAWEIIETGIAGNGESITRFYSTEGLSRRFFRSRQE